MELVTQVTTEEHLETIRFLKSASYTYVDDNLDMHTIYFNGVSINRFGNVEIDFMSDAKKKKLDEISRKGEWTEP